jgi:hypothetical protein
VIHDLDIDEGFVLILEEISGQGMPSDVTQALIDCREKLLELAEACQQTDAYLGAVGEVETARAEIADEWEPKDHLYRAWMMLLEHFAGSSGDKHQAVVRRYVPMVAGFLPD